jgi:beta-fructofuranosidase
LFIIYEQKTKRLIVDRRISSLSPDVDSGNQEGFIELAAGESLHLHVFLDRSVIEIFANDRMCLTSRVYPTRPNSLGVDLFIQSGAVKLKSLDIWDMRSIWPD